MSTVSCPPQPCSAPVDWCSWLLLWSLSLSWLAFLFPCCLLFSQRYCVSKEPCCLTMCLQEDSFSPVITLFCRTVTWDAHLGFRFAGPPLRKSESLHLAWGLMTCTSTGSPGDPEAVVLRPDTLGKACSEPPGGAGADAELVLTAQPGQRRRGLNVMPWDGLQFNSPFS